MLKLQAKIQDREGAYERVVLCQFKDKDENMVFVETVELHGEECFKIIADEGYYKADYFYPVKRYSITELEIYEGGR